MKIKLLFFALLFLIVPEVFAQDAPIGYTEHYGLPKWSENSNPSADSLNYHRATLPDQILYDLIVNTDSSQMIIENDVLVFSPYLASRDTFTTTATTNTTTVAGMTGDDIVVVTPAGGTYNVNDILFVSVGTGGFTVTRNSSGTSGLIYNYIWIKK